MQNYVLPGLCGAGGLARDRRTHLKSQGFQSLDRRIWTGVRRVMPLQAFAGESARATQTTQLP